MSGQDYELGRVDERVNVDKILKDVLDNLESWAPPDHVDALNTIAAIKRYREHTANAVKMVELLREQQIRLREGARPNVLPGNATITCPQCSTQHNRGPCNGVDVYRCLNCGDFFKGPAVRKLVDGKLELSAQYDEYLKKHPQLTFQGLPMTSHEVISSHIANAEVQPEPPTIAESFRTRLVPGMLETAASMLRAPAITAAELKFCREVVGASFDWLTAQVDKRQSK